MGKRKARGGLTGLSQFALNAFKQDDITVSTKGKEPEVEQRPAKRQRANVEAEGVKEDLQWVKKYDATGLVPYYQHASEVPKDLQKYFAQRERFFSKYSNGCLLDREGWYSVTPELVANQIAERCRCDTILDAFCGVGGNAIAFAKTCKRVIALDTSPTRLALARHNAQIYGVADRIEFILSDYIAFAKSHINLSQSQQNRTIDVVFLSPPWGGPSYLDAPLTVSETATPSSGEDTQEPSVGEHPDYSLASIQPIDGSALFNLSRQITPNIAYYLPRNTRLDEISDLLKVGPQYGDGDADPDSQEHVEVEEEWMGRKLKALTCYFGGLVDGQEALF